MRCPQPAVIVAPYYTNFCHRFSPALCAFSIDYTPFLNTGRNGESALISGFSLLVAQNFLMDIEPADLVLREGPVYLISYDTPCLCNRQCLGS